VGGNDRIVPDEDPAATPHVYEVDEHAGPTNAYPPRRIHLHGSKYSRVWSKRAQPEPPLQRAGPKSQYDHGIDRARD
jgi:hypothetical protein